MVGLFGAAALVFAATVAWLVLVALHGRTVEIRRRASRLLEKILRVTGGSE